MKIYIKSSIPSDAPSITIDIDVHLEPVVNNVAAAFSNIKPVYDDSMEIDEQALADYDNFIEELLGELEYNDFKLLRASESKSSVTSRYYTLANEEQVKANDIKYIVFLRVSEHHEMLDEDQKAWVREQRKKDLDKFKLPKTKKKQRFKVREVLVNNEIYPSYDAAMKDIIIKIQEWKQSIQ
jgi:hypothetical protein